MTQNTNIVEEQISFMQEEISQMSDEIYEQQKEIAKLTLDLINLKNKLNQIGNDSGIKRLGEEVPPPHY